MKLEPKDVPLDALLLDPNNYRFHDLPTWKPVSEARFHEPSVQNSALNMLKATSAFDLVQLKESIVMNGLVPLERIVVRPYPHDATKFVVVEGNRRIAAIRWLLEDQSSGAVTLEGAGQALKQLSVLLLDPGEPENVGAVRVLMAIRHVGGVKEWGAYQQARLIDELMKEPGATFTSVGRALAMRATEVGRRYRAAKALQQMESDEEWGDSAKPGFHGLFQEVFASSEVAQWLEWDEKALQFTSTDNLHDFYRWIAGDEEQSAKIERTLEIRQKLRPILGHARALAHLRWDGNLDEAFQIALQDSLAAKVSNELELATRSALRVLSALPAPQIKTLSTEQLNLLQQLAEGVKETLETYELLSVRK